MPTDEQRMREQFESRHIGPTNPDREWYLERLKSGEYRSGYTETKWREWRAAYMARDAEVQALREDRDSYKDAFERVLHSVGVRDDEIEELEERIRELREALEKVVKTRVAEPTDNLGDALIRLARALREARGIARAALAGGKGRRDGWRAAGAA